MTNRARVAQIGGLALCSILVFVVLGTAMLYVPGSPARRSIDHLFILESFRETPDAPGAGAAFDRFLELGRRWAWFDATVTTALTGVVVAAAARLGGALGSAGVAMVTLGFLIGRLAWPRGWRFEPSFVASIAVFGLVLWASERLRRGKEQSGGLTSA